MASNQLMNRKNFRKAIIVGEHIKNRSYSPFTLRSKLDQGKSYSDFFIYGTAFQSNTFIAENIYSMMLDEPLAVHHIFKFYDTKGCEISKHISATSDPFLRVNLPCPPTSDQYISFTHHVKPVQQHLEDAHNDLIARLMQSRGLQHRGYLIYKVRRLSIGSVVHGNFGGIALSENKYTYAAVKRNQTYDFTSAYSFSQDDQYHLVFNNPTVKKMSLRVKSCKENEFDTCELTLPPRGTEFIAFTGYKGNLVVKSSMPLCRPIVFKNPARSTGFDVFHP
ncbi:hypothetical protein [Synechococcus sp. LTW-R]|uniref:hypothetical protein n=1 Tax=Synechococcus sp. LTW-R TaxID=2751170 RepID=UPI0016261ED7|nr:hypothetical protein [Synechococcus sp. LTW-R]QNG28926.1 hypothetical protein H0O22_09245 [Synechococcus sp. LTW-R]